MSDQLITNLQKSRVVPLVQAEHPDEAVAVSKALLEGGLEVLEVVLRTDAAFDCLEAVAEAFPDVSVGAGTVLSPRMLKKRLAAVPSFGFAGLHAGVVGVAQKMIGHFAGHCDGYRIATSLEYGAAHGEIFPRRSSRWARHAESLVGGLSRYAIHADRWCQCCQSERIFSRAVSHCLRR